MGMSSSKKKTTNEPWAPAQPYIIKNLAQQDQVFQTTQPQLEQFAADQRATYGRVAPGAEKGILGAQGVVNDTLSGKYLSGNPFLDAILAKTRSNVTAAVNDQFGPAGRFGSGYHAKILADELAAAENQARYGDYAQERANQLAAVGQASGLMGGAQSLLNNAAELPWIGVQAANGAVRQASNGYGTTTTKESGSVFDNILKGVGVAAKAASAFSDERLKTDKQKLGTLPDGLDLFQFTYKADPTDTPQVGVMAQQVEKKYPEAVATDPATGFKKVDYGALGLDGIAPDMRPIDPVVMAAPKVKPTFNGPGGTAEKLGELGDYLLAAVGNPLGEYALRSREMAKQAQREEAQWSRRRQQQLQDQIAVRQWERENPAPRYFEANNGDQYQIGPDGKAVRVFADPTPKVQWQRVENGDGTFTMVPIVNGQIAGGAGQQNPTAPVGKLKPYGGAAPAGQRPF